MSVFANQPSSGEKLFARYFQNYFELVMSDLNDITNNDTTKWRNGLKDIGSWNDNVIDDELVQFKQTCLDADMLFKSFDLDGELKTFLHKIMMATTKAPAVIDRHYWTYPHRDRQAFLVDTIAMTARSLAIASRRRRGEISPMSSLTPAASVPATRPNEASAVSQEQSKASTRTVPTLLHNEPPYPLSPLPDESVSQASAATAVAAASTFSFDNVKSEFNVQAGGNAHEMDASRVSKRFPSQVSKQSRQNVKEFSIVSEKFMKQPPQSSIRELHDLHENDLVTGVEVI